MPRFFFDIKNHDGLVDQEGTELASSNDMRREGARFVATLLSDEAMRVELGPSWTLVVRDETDKVVLQLDVHSS